ncbi:MAG: hypothetical protein HY804_04625 [Nitrospinae bacterium]|nr:hypothetical protein [Nitrospinota bacterium]
MNGTGTTNGADATFSASACDAPAPSPSPSPSPEPTPEPTPDDNGGDGGTGGTVTPPNPDTNGGDPVPPAVTDNGAPTPPAANQPPDGATTESVVVTFEWEMPEDSHLVMSYLYVCADSGFAGCETPAASYGGGAARVLGRAAYGFGGVVLAMFGLLGWRRSGRGGLFMAVLSAASLAMALTLAACGPSSSTTAAAPTQTASATLTLQPGATYYWKVMDLYADGGVMASETRRFTTPAQ